MEKMMMGGGGGVGENETLNRMNLMSASTLQLNQGQISTSSLMKKDERVPQWSHQETRDFISIRAELERDFTVSKRNKNLWEIVSIKMKERGYRRSPDQCKCKWKNLVNRYKGKETSDPETGRQCPFFDEIQAVFTERAQNMHQLLVESESGTVQMKKKAKRISGGDRSSEEFTEEEDDGEEDSDGEERITTTTTRSSEKKRKTLKERNQKSTTTSTSNIGIDNKGGIQEMLQEFFQQQQRIEMEWREMMERRAIERRMFEQEWRQSMEKLERERLILEQAWREREEQRRMREESRAEKRDALLTTLLNKLIHEHHL